MIKRVILLTSSFPYGNGEQFLETEIEYLSRRFKKITIIPMSTGGIKRAIPKNIFVDENFAQQKEIFAQNKVKRFFSVIRSKIFYKEIFLNCSKLIYKYNISLAIGELSMAFFLSSYLEKYLDKYTIFYSYWMGMTSLSFILLKNDNIVTLSRVHKGELYEELHPYNYLPYRKIIYDNLTQIHSISQNGIEYIQNKYNHNKNNIFLSRLGVKEQKFITQISQNNQFIIISCSNFVEEKRFDLIIKSISLFAKQSKLDITWYHIGSGDGFEFYKQKALKHQSKNLHIKFLGYLHNKDVLQFYKDNNIDILINLSSSEGIPVSIMEAFSCSIPAIATDVGGVSEIVNNKNGYLLEKDFDINLLISYLNEISLNKNLLLEKKQESYNMWQKNYNAQKNYNNFINIIQGDI